MRKPSGHILSLIITALLLLTSCTFDENRYPAETGSSVSSYSTQSSGSIIESESPAYCVVNNNLPFFYENEYTTDEFETYSPLDTLGRCGVAYANISKAVMPTEERESIGSVKPTGWHTVKYSGVVEGQYLYNRCHLIGYQLAGENANECNLITGTRYMNTVGMLPFEDRVAEYVKSTGNHVLYRVTPKFDKDNLVADGVLMEAHSVEDGGELEFCVFCYNIQPGITIDYATGDSKIFDGTPIGGETALKKSAPISDYVLNTSSKKFHLPTCESVDDINKSNKKKFHGTRDELIAEGYEPCKKCGS